MAYPANAVSIQSAATGTLFNDEYSYLFNIEDVGVEDVGVIDPSYLAMFHATLTNTSPDASSPDDMGPLIDKLAFNIQPSLILGADFEIINVKPDWSFRQIISDDKKGGVQFDYVGDSVKNKIDRINAGDALSFDFAFFKPQTFDLWISAPESLGKGLGGGGDNGQVAVKFQQLGIDGKESDLLASNWGPISVPELSTLNVLVFGLIGLSGLRRMLRI